MSIRRSDTSNTSETSDAEEVDQSQSNDESRLSRWSRRKREAGQEDSEKIGNREDQSDRPGQLVGTELSDKPRSDSLTTDESTNQSDVETLAEEDQVLLTDADMPDIETLTADSDFKPFMSKGVSHALRRKALRKLFASPFFQIRDGLDDYDDDFASFAPLGDTVTADMKYAEERKEMLRREAEEEEQRKQLASEESSDKEDQPDSETEEALEDSALAEDTQAESPEADAVASELPPGSLKPQASRARARGGGFDDDDVDEDV